MYGSKSNDGDVGQSDDRRDAGEWPNMGIIRRHTKKTD